MKDFKCNICDASFAQKAHLNGHMASVHEGKKPFKCSIYDASFAEKISRKEAIQITNNVCTLDTSIHSYWGKYNPNLENCSYYEGRKPYYILKNFLSI